MQKKIYNFKDIIQGYIKVKIPNEEVRKIFVDVIEKGIGKLSNQLLLEIGFTYYGGVNAPYVWLKVPEGMTSWQFFDKLLEEVNIVGTPGSGFGPHGEEYFRLTAFGTKESTVEARERMKKWFR